MINQTENTAALNLRMNLIAALANRLIAGGLSDSERHAVSQSAMEYARGMARYR